jgi:hypothetical protein
MPNFPVLKKLFAVILSFSFFASTIIMPYSNFDDTRSLRSSYRESQQEDTDMDIGEFVFNKLFTIGELFDQGDDDNNKQTIPKDHQPIPLQIQPIQSGSLYCSKIIIIEQDKKPVPVKPTCFFREDKFSFDFHASVFHPPACIA